VESEAALRTELLAPAEEAMSAYRTRYLQAWDRVCEAVDGSRRALTELAGSRTYTALARLAALPQLGPDACPDLQVQLQSLASGLLSTSVARATLERELADGPVPASTPVSLHNAAQWIDQAQDATQQGEAALGVQLLSKAALLQSEALRARLRQGENEPLIARLLQAESTEALAAILVDVLGGDQEEAVSAIEVIARHLQKIVVRKVRLADFAPTERTLEQAALPQVTAEFRAFLERHFQAGADELVIIELE